MQINRMITNVNKYVTADNRKIKFIVVHFFGAFGSAKANALYFRDVYRKASAHYFVDEEEVWQVVDDADIAWHCGDPGPGEFKKVCSNYNSIGVEMRPKKINTFSVRATDNDWYFDDKTVALTVELVRELQEKYDIPDDRVIRHFDVTGKFCPRPFMGGDRNAFYRRSGDYMWEDFKAKLRGDDDLTQEQFNKMMDVYLEGLKEREPSPWSEKDREWAEREGLIAGDSNGQMQYKMFMTREQMVVFLKRIYNMVGIG